jgi:hypothetical protein
LWRCVSSSLSSNIPPNKKDKEDDGDDDEEEDPSIYAMKYLTEEGQKVDRNQGSKYYAVYERILPETSSRLHAGNFFL